MKGQTEPKQSSPPFSREKYEINVSKWTVSIAHASAKGLLCFEKVNNLCSTLTKGTVRNLIRRKPTGKTKVLSLVLHFLPNSHETCHLFPFVPLHYFTEAGDSWLVSGYAAAIIGI